MREGWKYIAFEDGMEAPPKTAKIPSSAYKESGKFPIVSQEDTLISGYWDNEKDVFRINHPVIVFGDHTRILKYIDFDFVIGADGVKILNPIQIIRPKFLFYYLIWCKIPSLGYSRHYKLLKELLIPVPPLPEQERIVAELDLLTEIIDKQKAQLKELDNLAQSIFYDMFGDPVENEKGCEVSTYGEQFEIGAGGTPSKANDSYWNNGTIPWIGSNMCQNCIIYETDGKYITEEGLAHSSAKLLDKGTILVALVGTTIGKVAFLNTITSTNQNIAFIKVPSNKAFKPMYVFFQLQSLYGKFMEIGNGDFKMANQSFIRSLPIPIPPIELQTKFTERIQSIEQQKSAINHSIAESQKLFDYTMDKYFG